MRNKLFKFIAIAAVSGVFCSFLSAQQSSLNAAEQNADKKDALTLGESVYKKRCFGCHGSEGEVKAFGISRKLTEITSDETSEKLKAFTDKKLQGIGGATETMHKQVTAISKQEYDAVLDYVLKNITPKSLPPQ
jgi:mono/diheme cytochrome c family protein